MGTLKHFGRTEHRRHQRCAAGNSSGNRRQTGACLCRLPAACDLSRIEPLKKVAKMQSVRDQAKAAKDWFKHVTTKKLDDPEIYSVIKNSLPLKWRSAWRIRVDTDSAVY